jgi:predicted TIM-barrel fold metal-dependent hydrolase
MVAGDGSDRVLIISSDGHAMAKMAEYRPYLPSRYHEEFDAFLKVHREHFSDDGIGDPRTMTERIDPEIVKDWIENVIEAGRLEGKSDPVRRLQLMEKEGVAAEVLFPDFGTPFELPANLQASLGITSPPERVVASRRAHNQWLADFCATAPDRLIGQAWIDFADVDEATEEIRWAKEAGLKGVVLPVFEEEVPLYHPRHDPIWETLAELEMPVNAHAGLSGTSSRRPHLSTEPDRTSHGCGWKIYMTEVFFMYRQMLEHFIWGGVLERHPTLKFILTEGGSGWVVGALEAMDFSYEGSFLPRSLRQKIKHKPSEYFQRQVHIGSSIFSRIEIGMRHQIGVDKMMLGMDYPHIEGTWGVGPGTQAYLQATLGAEQVTPAEAEVMLGATAQSLFGLDTTILDEVRRRIGPRMTDILTPPTEDHYPRGDVKKPIGIGVG